MYGNQDYCSCEILGHKFEVSLVSEVACFFTSHVQLHRYRCDISRQLDLTRLGVLPVKYKERREK